MQHFKPLVIQIDSQGKFEDFEKARRPPSKWKKIEGATNGEGGTDSTIEVDMETGAPESARSLKLTGDAGTRRWWSIGPELKAKPGELWRWSARVKAENVLKLLAEELHRNIPARPAHRQ